MTKKDYIRAAEIIREYGSQERMIEAFIEFFVGDNPAFNVDRFVEAASPPEGQPRGRRR